MLKKKINSVLLILVIGLWSVILYKLAMNYIIKKENNKVQNLAHIESKIKMIKKDSFFWTKPKRDPFLDVEYGEKIIVKPLKTLNSSSNRVEKKQPLKINIPLIQYFGYITTENNQSSALLKINNKKIKLLLNQEHEGLRLVTIYRDSIKVTYNNQSKIISKQK